jgi:hypothetical protein
MQAALVESGKLGSAARFSATAMDALQSGVRMYQSADNFNKVVAYEAKRKVALDAAERYHAGALDWAGFLTASKASLQDAKGGALLELVKEHLDRAELTAAAHALALDFSKATQFVYTRGNAPYVMQSGLGRLFLQYGTWPMWYAEWFANNLWRRGSWAENAGVAARWTAMNGAIYYGLGNAFGVDFSRWSWFAPFGYSGGPFLEMAVQASNVGQAALTEGLPPWQDPIANIDWERLKSGGPRQVIPLPIAAYRNYADAWHELAEGDYADFARRAFGMHRSQ